MEAVISISDQEGKVILEVLEKTPVAGFKERNFINSLEHKIEMAFQLKPQPANEEQKEKEVIEGEVLPSEQDV